MEKPPLDKLCIPDSWNDLEKEAEKLYQEARQLLANGVESGVLKRTGMQYSVRPSRDGTQNFLLNKALEDFKAGLKRIESSKKAIARVREVLDAAISQMGEADRILRIGQESVENAYHRISHLNQQQQEPKTMAKKKKTTSKKTTAKRTRSNNADKSDAQLIKELEAANAAGDANAAKRIRAALRNRGHRGGLGKGAGRKPGSTAAKKKTSKKKTSKKKTSRKA